MNKLKFIHFLFLPALLTLGACKEKTNNNSNNPMYTITSPAFASGQPIPKLFTCDSLNVSPELILPNVHKAGKAKSMALIMDDPDAPGGTWVHWLVFNIPLSTQKIAQGETITWNKGTTSFGNQNYGGPCPPSGTHRYFFRIYDLDIDLPLSNGASRAQIDVAMNGHILDSAILMGTYAR